MATLTINASRLRKSYGTRAAVRDLTIQVGRGEAFGFLGPNGAGKSTSVKMLLGLVKPTGGNALLLGQPVGTRAVRARIGFLPEHFRFYDWLSASELILFHGRLCGLAEDTLRHKVPRLLERVGLGTQHNKPIRSFSKGMMQRVGLAQAIVNDPEILFLDEPTSGLDPAGRKLVRDVIGEQCHRGATVFLNSHLLGEVEQSCDRVAFIRDGIIVGEYQMNAWQSAQTEVEIKAARVSSVAMERLKDFTNNLHLKGETLRLRVTESSSLPHVVRCLVESGAEVFSVVPQRVSLEDLFLQVMGPEPGR
ncbi:MAG TPA: ABC transporter ATP-binding protein [Acidobacteriaceae bacterium]|nr:ABC transporter ATP-binding protein [Acidobacteriaceae bacterium]